MNYKSIALGLLCAAVSFGQFGGELRFCLRADPKTFDPLLVEDDNSEAVRYLTGGVLLHVNRVSQEFTPELAASWKVDLQGRRITFQLRHDVTFSDGTPFSSADVAYTMTKLMDPKLHSPTADPFRSSNDMPQLTTPAPDTVAITFGAPVSGLERLFDQVAILSAHSPKAVLGPFLVADYKPGVEVLLSRNPHYWKKDSAGRRLPYLDRIHLQIQENRDMELVKFRRGEVDLINSLDPEVFEQLSRQSPSSVADAGASLESEMMWFNQAAKSPLPAYKKAWFANQQFRRAVSETIHREDIAKVVYKGHAKPSEGPISPANKFWVNAALKPHAYDVTSAMHRLEQEGFHRRDNVLYDRDGHAVEFSLATNAGNRSREQMAAMIQQDLQAIGIKVTIAALDFPSLIERMTKSFQYEACLLGLTNLDLDPSAQMNVWLSSAENHQWNPSEPTPATPWEAEVDKLMRAQAGELSAAKRKQLFDRVQQIVWEQEPFLYLVDKNSLMAFSPMLRNVAPSAIQPRSYWNIDVLQKSTTLAGEPLMAFLSSALLHARLSAGYGKGPDTLRDVEFEVNAGEVLGLVGESGSGKSTIALAILRLLEYRGGYARGELRFQGRELLRLSERQMRSVRGCEIGLVLQSPLSSLNPAMTIGDQIREAHRAHNKPVWIGLRQLLETVNLPSDPAFLARYPRQISVGQAQRVLIAMAIVHRPDLLVADEPTSALDTVTQAEILKLFARLNREFGMSILYISHDLLSVASLCHRLAILRQGEMVECGSTEQIFRQPSDTYTKALLAAIPTCPFMDSLSAESLTR